MINIGVIANPKNDACAKAASSLFSILKEYNTRFFSLYQNSSFSSFGAKILSEKEFFQTCNLIITLGGDGVILHAAPMAAEHDVPILGINLGTIGYMAEVDARQIELVRRYFEGTYRTDNRMLLNVEIVRNNKLIGHYTALNEAVVSKGSISRIIRYDIAFNDRCISDYRADGIIFSTPTGSTAYSMSAGGPIVQPDYECIILTPICPYSLTARPIVFSPLSKLSIHLPQMQGKDAFLAVDGRVNAELYEKDCITIRKADKPLKLIALKDISFYEILNIKLMDGGNKGET